MKTLSNYISKKGLAENDSLEEAIGFVKLSDIVPAVEKTIDAFNAKTLKMGSDFNKACQMQVKKCKKNAIAKAVEAWAKKNRKTMKDAVVPGNVQYMEMIHAVCDAVYGGKPYPFSGDFDFDENSGKSVEKSYNILASTIAKSVK